ncbi:hypothetical protein KVP02_13510, partial [Halobacterium salinarum]|uniref:hypothetical protein n=1 Tax=Halobacterium salinarum TaxID=2242 RepID=UPI001F2C2E27
LLNRERGAADALPKKSLHKLLYRIDVKSAERNLDISIPYYWYLFGTVSPATPSTVPSASINEPGLEDRLRSVVSEALSEYYEHGLEWLTDRMYDDAPYQVQRDFRELDKKIRTLHTEYHDFFEVDPSRESVLSSVHDTFESFPNDRFPEYDRPLIKWYTAVTRELHSHSPDPSRLMTVNVTFWRIFALELAQRHAQGMSPEEVRGNLGITSFEEARSSAIQKLDEFEEEDLDAKFSGLPTELESE